MDDEASPARTELDARPNSRFVPKPPASVHLLIANRRNKGTWKFDLSDLLARFFKNLRAAVGKWANWRCRAVRLWIAPMFMCSVQTVGWIVECLNEGLTVPHI